MKKIYLSFGVFVLFGLSAFAQNNSTVSNSAQKRSWGIGLSAGAGGAIIIGDFTNYYTNTALFVTNLDLRYSRLHVSGFYHLGGGKLQTELSYKETTWPAGNKYRMDIAGVSLGLAIIEREKIRIIPNVSLSYSEFESKNIHVEDNLLGLRTGYTYGFGITTDVKMGNLPKGETSAKKKLEHYLRFGINAYIPSVNTTYWSDMNSTHLYEPFFNGWIFNFSVSYGGLFQHYR